MKTARLTVWNKNGSVSNKTLVHITGFGTAPITEDIQRLYDNGKRDFKVEVIKSKGTGDLKVVYPINIIEDEPIKPKQPKVDVFIPSYIVSLGDKLENKELLKIVQFYLEMHPSCADKVKAMQVNLNGVQLV